MSKSWKQILGGYATDTLTEEEKRQLFEAALHDQTLFDALADEEALKALLADPEARQRILASLQSGNSQETATSQSSWLSWFRRPSSLAWAGSIAAMGLALIFGWQMEKDWGPLVRQEQQVESSVSEDEVAFLSQPSRPVEMKDQVMEEQKVSQREPEPAPSLPALTSKPQPSTIDTPAKKTDRMRQSSAKFRSEGVLRQEIKKERRLKAKEPLFPAPESRVVLNVPEEDQFVAPSVVAPSTVEEDFQQLSRSPTFADQARKGILPSSPSARDLFYANKGKRADGAEEKIDGMRAQQLLREMSPKKERELESSDLKETQEVVANSTLEANRGIRYRFVLETLGGKDEGIDITQFSGKWSDLRLEIESNVPGYLYVLTQYAKGKWQLMHPKSLNITVSSDGTGIEVNPYQSVNFILSQVTNRLGKPVVSSITVLLSSAPLTNLGKWLGGKDDMTEVLVERAKAAVFFVVDTTSEPGSPFKAEIFLK